ncbi:MAG: hypothetical protein JXR65_05315 [Bacteroidales bacterium]|nr:hypothetical protein [Bacteroidales bacterium]
MKTLLKTLLILLFLLMLQNIRGQSSDTLQPSIDNALEDLARSSDAVADYSDLLEKYRYFVEHPVSINGSGLNKLMEIRVINQAQLFTIETYIRQNGFILSANELNYVPGLSKEFLSRIQHFVTFTAPLHEKKKASLRKILSTGKSRVLFRYEQQMEHAEGYKIPADSAFLKPGSAYLGTPQKLYFRYAFQADQRIKAGITAEKDAGEVFMGSKLNDSVQQLLSKTPGFPDFISAYALVSDFGVLKKAVIGDYHLEFGQGLTLWSGLAFGKSSQATQVKYYADGIRPNTSVNENLFFRGVAAEFGYKNLKLTTFYSNKKYDANLEKDDSTELELATSLQETGYHRTINELNDKNALAVSLFGAHLNYEYKQIRVGGTWYKSQLNIPLQRNIDPYALYNFYGKALQNAGLDLNVGFSKFSFFSELGYSSNGGLAGIAGLNTFFSDRLSLTLLYRNYSKKYQTLFANPFRVSGHVGNEKGIYLGLEALLAKSMTLNAYVDLYTFPWLRYQSNAPSSGKSYLLQLNFEPKQNLGMYLQFRFTQKQINYTANDSYFAQLKNENRYELSYQISYTLFQNFILKNRLEYVHYGFVEDQQLGFLFYQDVFYKPAKIPLSAGLRLAMFNTGGWNSRIYTYENDVLYAFSIPALYDHGFRTYFLLSWEPLKNLKFWFRAATTIFYGKTELGTGADAVEGNHKSTLKAQVQWKF